MHEQQVRPLDQMDEREASRFLAGLLSRLDPEEEYEARHEDYVVEWPQSGERIRGRETMRRFQRSYSDHAAPPPDGVRLRRVLVREGLWVVEGAADYGGRTLGVVMISELRDGKMWRDRWYFADPFEPPAWRAQWVEKMEPAEAVPPETVSANGRETDGAEVRRLVDRQLEMMRAGDYAGAHGWYDESVVVEWPQSGERIRGKENLLALRRAYPAGVGFEARRVLARRDLAVCEYTIRYDGRPVYVIAIVEFGDGRVVRETHYFAEPFEPPGWRARWVERMGAETPAGSA